MGERVMQFLLARLREPSTWRGIILLLTALGYVIRPDLAEAIITLGLALAGGVGAMSPDRPERLRDLPDSSGDASSAASGDAGDIWGAFRGGTDRD